MKILSNIQNEKDIVSKEYVDNHAGSDFHDVLDFITGVHEENLTTTIFNDLYTFMTTHQDCTYGYEVEESTAQGSRKTYVIYSGCEVGEVTLQGYKFIGFYGELKCIGAKYYTSTGTFEYVNDLYSGGTVIRSSSTPYYELPNLWIEDSDVDGSGGGGGSSIEVIDSLNSTSTEDALSANQGRVLNGRLTTVENSGYLTTSDIVDALNSTSTTDALSANQGKELNTRLAALEGDNLDSRLDTLEGQNLDSRLDTIEAKNLVESTNISKIVMVTEYPSTPDPDTLYVKVASL